MLLFVALASILPVVRDGAVLLKRVRLNPFKVNVPVVSVKVPATVVAEPNLTPPLPLMVKLLIFPVKVDAGKVQRLVFVNITLALELLASMPPAVYDTVAPFIVNVFAPIVKTPAVKVNVFVTVTFEAGVTVPLAKVLLIYSL